MGICNHTLGFRFLHFLILTTSQVSDAVLWENGETETSRYRGLLQLLELVTWKIVTQNEVQDIQGWLIWLALYWSYRWTLALGLLSQRRFNYSLHFCFSINTKASHFGSESKWKHQGWPFRINPVRTTTVLSRYHKIFFTILVRVILLHPNAKAQISNRFFSFIIEEQSNRVAREVHDTLFFSQEREGEPWIRKAGSRLCGMWFLIPGSGQC